LVFKKNQVSEEQLYSIVLEEINNKKYIEVLMAKAFVEAEGNDKKAKALYIKFRIESLKKEIPALLKNQAIRKDINNIRKQKKDIESELEYLKKNINNLEKKKSPLLEKNKQLKNTEIYSKRNIRYFKYILILLIPSILFYPLLITFITYTFLNYFLSVLLISIILGTIVGYIFPFLDRDFHKIELQIYDCESEITEINKEIYSTEREIETLNDNFTSLIELEKDLLFKVRN